MKSYNLEKIYSLLDEIVDNQEIIKDILRKAEQDEEREVLKRILRGRNNG